MTTAVLLSVLASLAAARPRALPPHRHAYHLHDSTTDNWAGVVSQGKNVNHVTGTFIVPNVSGGSKNDCASFWVGIDGYKCKTQAIEQLGIDVCGDGSIAPWFEWFPDDSIYTTDLAVSAGDKLRLTVDASSTTSGIGYIENLTTGNSVNQTWTKNPAHLCEREADWIVEDFEDGNKNNVPFVDFGSVTFTDAVATSADGSTLTPSGGELITMEKDDGTVMTKCSRDGDDLTCKWESN